MEKTEEIKEEGTNAILHPLEETKRSFFLCLIRKIIFFKGGRDILLNKFDKKLYSELILKNENSLGAVQEKKYHFLMSMLGCAKRNADKGWISKKVADRMINTLVKFSFVQKELQNEIREKFKKKYGMLPPSFVVISPTQSCNLKCTGCYASSRSNASTLSFEIVDKIANEVYNEWGNRFMTISGGEPLMYHSESKTLFDIWKKYNEMFFLFYTNGTLIDKKMAERLAELGNVTPAISIEGWEKETDERRGKGIFKKIVEAAENLKKAGVPFGFSITATNKNIDTLLDDKFYDFLFQELGATYAWMFQLMPIGQAKNLKELMITPEQRVKLLRKQDFLLKEKRYCIADFWNSGVLVNGCIAYGRNGGYLYIDWNGNIMPCVFVPYYEDNIMDLYKKDKKLADALFSDMFIKGRKWQEDYGLNHPKNPDNLLMPCSIRDHWMNFRKNILSEKSKPEDKYAEEALNSKEYDKELDKFDKKLKELTESIWKKEYLKE